MKTFLSTIWPYLAIAACFGAGVLHGASGINCVVDDFFGIQNVLFFVGLGAVYCFATQGFSRGNTEEEDDLKRNAQDLYVTLKEQVKNLQLVTVHVSLHKRIQEAERKLKEVREERSKKKENEKEVRSILRFTKQQMDHQALEDKIRCLEDQKNLLERQIAANEKSKLQLEENLLRIKEDNKRLEKNAAEMTQRNEDLNNKVTSLTAQLANVNCRLVQREIEADKMNQNLCQLTEEKMKMEKHIQSQVETINRHKKEREEMQLKIQNLQKEVRFLSQEKENLECQLQGKDVRLQGQNALLQERDCRLQEMAKKASITDEENHRLQDQLRQLQGEKERCLHDLENRQMQKKQQEETNLRLQKQISVLMRWRNGVAVDLKKTDIELVNKFP